MVQPVRADDDLRIAVVGPASGNFAVLGKQLETGASAALNSATGAESFFLDDACEAQGGEAAARQAIERKARIVIGFLCTESLEAALPLLKAANIPVIVTGVRLNSLTDNQEKSGWPLVRIAPRADAENVAVAHLLPRFWRDKPFAIIDDGTIYGRELAESFRAAVEDTGLKPVFTDTYRPDMDNQVALVGRLRKAGATRAFAGGSLRDVAIMARDARKLDAEIVFAGGEVLRQDKSEVPLEAGTLMVGLTDWQETGDTEVLDELAKAGIAADGYVLPAYAAAQIATQVLQAEPENVFDALKNGTFKTALGDVAFDTKGDMRQNPYALYKFDGSRFVEEAR